ncbi:MAG: TonB-dependent receptor [Burkholderiales bacterium]|nr:TonB-dependent receptor [Burkholderiales bacterium]
MRFQVNKLSLLISGLFLATSALVHADDAKPATTTDVGKITVEGLPGGTDTGLIQQEDTPKARSSVSRAYLEKLGGTANPYQAISLLPGVSTNDYDGTGLFGGSIRVRGFNSDQLGFTVNGAPVNDSGSFAVYPQEYLETENVCNIFVTQGSTDVDAPHVGASGGNIGIVTCDPEDKQRVRVEQEVGSNYMWKTYARFDSGRVLDDKAKFLISVSKAEADKYRGNGKALKEHVDFDGRFDLGAGSFINASFLWNRELNNNYELLSKAQLAQNGWTYDYNTQPPVHQPSVNGSATNDPAYGPNAPVAANLYNGTSLNPFINTLTTVQAHFALSPKAALDIDPYFWYGYGTGGNQLQTLTEATGPNAFAGGTGDVNGDGNAKDKIYVYEGSVTKTTRPGMTTKFNYQWDNQHIVAGYWYERAHHRQTAPFETIDNNGNPSNVWLNNPDQWIRTADGQPLEYRNTMTVSTAQSLFAQDNISLLQDKLNVQLGLRDLSINRDFHNYASAGSSQTNPSSSGADYGVNMTYRKTLPTVGARYQFDDQQSTYFNVTENFRAPGNYDYFNLLNVAANNPNASPLCKPAPGKTIGNGGACYINGQLVGYTLTAPIVQPETSWDYDFGYRFQGEQTTFTADMFYVDFQNRIASQYNDFLQTSVDQNVGTVHQYGIELELGQKLAKSWSLYSSLSYIKTRMENNLDVGHLAGNNFDSYLPTSGKEMPDTPTLLAGLHLDYTHANWNGFLEAKYTGKRYTTLVNDDAVSGYTLLNAGGGYKFGNTGFFKSPTIKFNILNLLGTHYLSMNGPSGSQYANNAYNVNVNGGVYAPSKPLVNGIPQAPTFYLGQPRSYYVTLQSDF